MKNYLIVAATAGVLFTSAVFAQGGITVPKVVKDTFESKYPDAKHVNWEKEKGNFEANWGGKSGEDNSALYSPAGTFVEIAKAISIKQRPVRESTLRRMSI